MRLPSGRARRGPGAKRNPGSKGTGSKVGVGRRKSLEDPEEEIKELQGERTELRKEMTMERRGRRRTSS